MRQAGERSAMNPAGAGSIRLWWAGARPRTLPASISPVIVGTAVAAAEGKLYAGRVFGALVVALALQVGVNYANDYSDGKRGADARRVGPMRLTASGAVPADAVKRAAMTAFAVAAAAGFVLSVAVDLRLLLVGAASIAAAALYTGGPRPYGYSGFGELAVLVFFGFVATIGSAYVHTEQVSGTAVLASLPVGLVACALLVVNNLRDIATDTEAGKRTLAVRLGAARTRMLYRGCIVGAYAAVVLLAVARPPVALALGTAPLAVVPLRLVSTRRDPPGLIAALVATGRLQLILASVLAVGLWVS